MSAKKSDKQRVITRTRKWTTKSGQKREKTYYYITTPGEKTKNGVKKATKLTKVEDKIGINRANFLVEKGKKADNIDALISQLDAEDRRYIENRLKEAEKLGKSLTFDQMKKEISKEQRKNSPQRQFLLNLGYSEEEFAEEFGLTVSDLEKGKFEEVEKGNNSVISFTLGTKVYIFQWDYDRGLVQT